MSSTVERIKKVISYSEIQGIKTVVEGLNEQKEAIIIVSKLADKVGIARSIVVNAFKLLEVTGIVETRSLGMRGTFIRVIDEDAIKQLVQY